MPLILKVCRRFLRLNPLTPVFTVFSHWNNIVLVVLPSTVHRQRVKESTTTQLFTGWLPSIQISYCKHVALKQTTIEHVLHRNLFKDVTYKVITRRKIIIYTVDILSGLLSDKLKLLLWIFVINMEVLKFLIIESTKTPEYSSFSK